MKKYVIIMAGGVGLRMGVDTPKQFLLLAGRPLILHSIDKFLRYDSKIKLVVVLPESAFDQWKALCDKYDFTNDHILTAGGDERFYSVKNGLKETEGDSLIAIHDSVRPLVSLETIHLCFETAQAKGNAIPVISITESVRETEGPGLENRPLDRSGLRLVQTPQVFNSKLLYDGYECGFSPHFTDDATVVESQGIKINLVEGNRENIKITRPEDLLIADTIFKNT